jgi:NTE family protein
MSGFLAGAQHACGVDFREANEFVGTSAGSIVAAHLANGIEPRVPQQSDALAQLDVTDRDIPMARIDRAFREWVTALYPITRRATAASGTVGALARAALLIGLPAGVRSMEELRNGYAATLGSRSTHACGLSRSTGRRGGA